MSIHLSIFSFLDDNLSKYKWNFTSLSMYIGIVEIWAWLFSVVSLMSSLRVISLTVLADTIHNILIFFAEKM